jgi:hypothetical protein
VKSGAGSDLFKLRTRPTAKDHWTNDRGSPEFVTDMKTNENEILLSP